MHIYIPKTPQNTFGHDAGIKEEHVYTCVCAKSGHTHIIACVLCTFIYTHGHIAGIKVQHIRTYLCGTVISLYLCMYSFYTRIVSKCIPGCFWYVYVHRTIPSLLHICIRTQCQITCVCVLSVHVIDHVCICVYMCVHVRVSHAIAYRVLVYTCEHVYIYIYIYVCV